MPPVVVLGSRPPARHAQKFVLNKMAKVAHCDFGLHTMYVASEICQRWANESQRTKPNTSYCTCVGHVRVQEAFQLDGTASAPVKSCPPPNTAALTNVAFEALIRFHGSFRLSRVVVTGRCHGSSSRVVVTGRFHGSIVSSCPDKRWDDPGFFSCKRAERPPDLPGPREGPFAWIWALYRIPEEVGPRKLRGLFLWPPWGGRTRGRRRLTHTAVLSVLCTYIRTSCFAALLPLGYPVRLRFPSRRGLLYSAVLVVFGLSAFSPVQPSCLA